MNMGELVAALHKLEGQFRDNMNNAADNGYMGAADDWEQLAMACDLVSGWIIESEGEATDAEADR